MRTFRSPAFAGRFGQTRLWKLSGWRAWPTSFVNSQGPSCGDRVGYRIAFLTPPTISRAPSSETRNLSARAVAATRVPV